LCVAVVVVRLIRADREVQRGHGGVTAGTPCGPQGRRRRGSPPQAARRSRAGGETRWLRGGAGLGPGHGGGGGRRLRVRLLPAPTRSSWLARSASSSASSAAAEGWASRSGVVPAGSGGCAVEARAGGWRGRRSWLVRDLVATAVASFCRRRWPASVGGGGRLGGAGWWLPVVLVGAMAPAAVPGTPGPAGSVPCGRMLVGPGSPTCGRRLLRLVAPLLILGSGAGPTPLRWWGWGSSGSCWRHCCGASGCAGLLSVVVSWMKGLCGVVFPGVSLHYRWQWWWRPWRRSPC
jgi:hypothetical protein